MNASDVWPIAGALPPTDFKGYADDRFPDALADRAIESFSAPGDWVLDPFAGLGTTLFSAARLGRRAIGFEANAERAEHVATRLPPPHRLVPAKVQDAALDELPKASLILTSPPYPTVNLADDPWGPTYFADMQAIFSKLATALAPGGHLVVEVSNVRTDDGFRPLSAEFGAILRTVLRQTSEILRVNTDTTWAGPGTHYSALLVFRADD
jgi:SAM-dependent methyltransferase